MANQVVARLAGDDYQHLFSWHMVLDLLRPGTTVERVRLEDEDAMSVDDVTVHHVNGRSQYFQVKCHVDHRSGYCVSSLVEAVGNKSSLLQKWMRSFRKIRDVRAGLLPEIYLVSNWGWTADDILPSYVCGRQECIKSDFFAEGPRTGAGKLRKRLRQHLGVDDAQLEEFLRCLRFKISFGSLNDIAERVSERMLHVGLKCDEASLHVAAGVVRTWIKNGPVELTAETVRARIAELGLWLPAEAPDAIHVHLMTIKDQRFDIEPDFRLDWRDYFVGPGSCKGHEVLSPDIWNSRLMPDLVAIEQRINTTMTTRLLRVRGKARLSAWTAFGSVFSQVNGYTLEVDQNGQTWSTANVPAPDFRVIVSNAQDEPLTDQGDTVAVGVSISGNLDEDVRRDMQQHGTGVRALLLLKPERGLGPACLRDGADAMALATQVKSLMRDFAKKHEARRMLLYYFGPLGGACFLGHQLNAVCPQIQVMERIGEPGREYVSSFTLESS